MRKFFLILSAFILQLTARAAQECPTITMTADPERVTIDEPVSIVSGTLEGGSGYYTWYKNGEVVSEGTMSLGEFTLYYLDEKVADTPCDVTYKLTITNKGCESAEQITVTLIDDPLNAEEAQSTACEAKQYYNLAGVPICEPRQAGIYIVKESTGIHKIQVP